ncbi:MAG TPA: alpha/beta hydrolase [Solirubrobacteraceae bacterium]|nr:alpha/beta hydrolase [Solirubrobacteraceae bacterium]
MDGDADVGAGARRRLDPEIAAGLRRFEAAEGARAEPPPGDWRALREALTADIARLASLESHECSGLDVADAETVSADGAAVRLRWYARRDSAPGSAVVFVHGGGAVAGNIDLYDGMVSAYVDGSGVPALSVDYRLAPEAGGDAATQDVLAALRWLHERAPSLGVDRGRIAVMGESAGGLLAAVCAIAARDQGLGVAAQILIYPMLDDRTAAVDDDRAPLLTWSVDANVTAWRALLGDAVPGKPPSPLIAPARLERFDGLAPAYIEVGDLDLFRDECLAYATRLAGAGVPLELHVHPREPHGYERFAPASDLARRALADRVRVLRSL